LELRDDAARQSLVIDPHSPAIARVNGPMHNLDAWYKAFDVTPGEKLYLSPADRIKIW
jgi:predicted metalloendopeptidase